MRSGTEPYGIGGGHQGGVSYFRRGVTNPCPTFRHPPVSHTQFVENLAATILINFFACAFLLVCQGMMQQHAKYLELVNYS